MARVAVVKGLRGETERTRSARTASLRDVLKDYGLKPVEKWAPKSCLFMALLAIMQVTQKAFRVLRFEEATSQVILSHGKTSGLSLVVQSGGRGKFLWLVLSALATVFGGWATAVAVH